MLIPIGILDSAGGIAGAYELISTAITSGGQTTITFSVIPQTYKHLELRVSARGANSGATDAGNSAIRINSTTANLAYQHYLYGNNTANATYGQASSSMVFTPASGAGAGIYSGHTMTINDYTSTTKTKTIRSVGGFMDTNSSGFVSLNGFIYNATTAVTSITFINTTAFGYAADSRFSLYGIKG